MSEDSFLKVHYARDPLRLNAKDYLMQCCDEIAEIHGDRLEGDDPSVICAVVRMAHMSVALIAQYTGRTPLERMHTQSGKTRPLGYRKIQRFLAMAKKFKLPLLTLIDTPGADASPLAAEANQSKAIADTLSQMATYPYASIGLILNQGMSGGAISLAMTDELWMMSHAVFSVISPEGCAAILWKDRSRAPEAAAMLKLSALSLKQMGVIDRIVESDEHDLKSALLARFAALIAEDPLLRLQRRDHRWDRIHAC